MRDRSSDVGSADLGRACLCRRPGRERPTQRQREPNRMTSENARDWVAESAYCKALGITFESVSDQKAILVLPFRKENTNQTGVLHGGIAASLGVSTSMAMAQHALAPESGPLHTPNYSKLGKAPCRE